MEIEESGVVISRDELIVDEPAPFAAVDLPITPVMSDENFSAAGVKVLIIQTPPSDEVASLEVPLVAVEAEEHSIPIIVNNEPSNQEPSDSPLRRRSERLAASVPMAGHSQNAPRRQSNRLAAKEH